MDVPEYQPATDRRPPRSGLTGTSSGSCGAPRTSNFPLMPSPPSAALIASPFVTDDFSATHLDEFRRHILRLTIYSAGPNSVCYFFTAVTLFTTVILSSDGYCLE